MHICLLIYQSNSISFEWMSHLATVQRKGRYYVSGCGQQTGGQKLWNKIIIWIYDNPRAEARYEVMTEGEGGGGGDGEKEKDRMSRSLQPTDRRPRLIRWGICRRHTDQPTAYFYDPQSSYASFMPPSHPPSSLLLGPWATWVGCGDLYLSACVCVMCMSVCEVVKLSQRLRLQTHYQPIGIPDYQHEATNQYHTRIQCL